MRVVGEWFRCDDGSVVPSVIAYVLAADGSLRAERFLVDSGADRTVFSVALAADLKLPANPRPDAGRLVGIGGTSESVLVTSLIQFVRDDGQTVRVHGEYEAFTARQVVDLSILGRDVLNNFDLIVSRPRDEVLLLHGRHQYRVIEQ
jgi:hypothetical protein